MDSTAKSVPSPSSAGTSSTPTSKALYSTKLSDQRARAPEATTQNQSQRQIPAQQKAWGPSGKNPITGRSQTPQNDLNSQNKQSVTNNLREGQRVHITLVTKAEFEGIYANGPDSASFRLNLSVQKKLPNSNDITNGTGRRDQTIPTMTIQRNQVTDARVLPNNQAKNDGKAPNGNRSSFRTDAAISNSRAGAERALKPWMPESNDQVDGGLESSTIGHWDQFAENEKRFGLKTDYNENYYTTAIDKSHPQYKQRMANAERTAREIERSAPVTAHVAEERVMDFSGGDDRDEEEKYSGVRRQEAFPPLGNASINTTYTNTNRENKYTPPARRAPTGGQTVRGAPVDPAIIMSQLKVAPAQKPAEAKNQGQATSPPAPVSGTANQPESKVELKDQKTAEAKPVETKTEVKPTDATSVSKAGTPNQPSASPAQSASRPGNDGATVPSGAMSVEHKVLKDFRVFANTERNNINQHQKQKAKQDREVKLNDLKKFSSSFKLSTPVPKDLIPIISKDPERQKEIQEKALRDAEDLAKQKAVEAATKDAAKESQTKPTTESTSAAATPAESRSSSRPTAPQHANSPSGMPNRHPGGRSYNNQAHYRQFNQGGRPAPHMTPQNQSTGNLGNRLQKIQQHGHMGQHTPVQDMRLPPTGPANNGDPAFGRRISNVPPSYLGPKLNPNSHEFRPNAFAAPFNPAGPSQGSSPRSSINIVEAPRGPVAATVVPGQLIRRKTKAVDVKKCFILSHLETFQPPPARDPKSSGVREMWSQNGGLKPAYEFLPTWRQLREDEPEDSTMSLSYNEYFENLPRSSAVAATPNPTHALPQIPHQHQLPLHLQHGAQTLAPRQSPHMPPIQMHGSQHGPGAPNVPFSAPDDHRMMHSNSAQSFASPRMGQVPIAYPQGMNSGQIQYQPVQYMNPAAPQMGYRSFSNNPQQFMQQQQQQQPHHMGAPMMMPQQFMMGPNGMVAAGPGGQMYPAAPPQFMAPNTMPPPAMGPSNGFPSPGRPAAPMMAHQGSHQGQPAVYGMSPGMQYQQPVYPIQQHPQGRVPGPRPQ